MFEVRVLGLEFAGNGPNPDSSASLLLSPSEVCLKRSNTVDPISKGSGCSLSPKPLPVGVRLQGSGFMRVNTNGVVWYHLEIWEQHGRHLCTPTYSISLPFSLSASLPLSLSSLPLSLPLARSLSLSLSPLPLFLLVYRESKQVAARDGRLDGRGLV